MARWHKPDWLYEPLPFIYILIGLASAIGTGNILGVSCGLALCSAGVAIWQMRRTYRKGQAEPEITEPSLAGRGDPAESRVTNLAWKQSFNVGHAVIDRQHRHLFRIINDIVDHLLTGKPKGDTELLLDDLVQEMREHLQAEEEIMEKHGRPVSSTERDTRIKLLSRMKHMCEDFHFDQIPVNELIGFLSRELVADHIANGALKFNRSAPAGSVAANA